MNSVSNENAGAAFVSPALTAKFGATLAVPPYCTPPFTSRRILTPSR